MSKPSVNPRFRKHWEALQKKAKELGLNTLTLTNDEPNPGHDLGDTAASATEKEMVAVLLTINSNLRLMVQWAIQRLSNGDGEYGTCMNCGEEIPEKRLSAVPWTPLCIRCQEQAEAGKLNGT